MSDEPAPCPMRPGTCVVPDCPTHATMVRRTVTDSARVFVWEINLVICTAHDLPDGIEAKAVLRAISQSNHAVVNDVTLIDHYGEEIST